jgi:hypothetical protein
MGCVLSRDICRALAGEIPYKAIRELCAGCASTFDWDELGSEVGESPALRALMPATTMVEIGSPMLKGLRNWGRRIAALWCGNDVFEDVDGVICWSRRGHNGKVERVDESVLLPAFLAQLRQKRARRASRP